MVTRLALAVRLGAGTLVLLLVAACATQPPHPKNPLYPSGYLASDTQVVGRLMIASSPELKKALDQQASLKDVIDRAQALWFSFNMNKLKPVGWRLVLTGDYPKGLVGVVLDGKPGWKKQNEPGPQWRAAKLGISVALPEDGIVTAQASPFVSSELSWVANNTAKIPPMVVASTDLFVDFRSPSQALFGNAGARLLPIEDLRLVLKATKDGWNGPVILFLPSEQAAKTTVFLLRIVAGTVSGSNALASQLATLHWKVAGNSVIGENLILKNSVLIDLVDKLLHAPEGAP